MDTSLLIKQFIETELISNEEQQELSVNDELITTGIIDSLGIIKLLQFITENFSVSIDDREIVPENFTSIQAIATLIQGKMG